MIDDEEFSPLSTEVKYYFISTKVFGQAGIKA